MQHHDRRQRWTEQEHVSKEPIGADLAITGTTPYFVGMEDQSEQGGLLGSLSRLAGAETGATRQRWRVAHIEDRAIKLIVQ
jgi:hypothetical protein